MTIYKPACTSTQLLMSDQGARQRDNRLWTQCQHKFIQSRPSLVRHHMINIHELCSTDHAHNYQHTNIVCTHLTEHHRVSTLKVCFEVCRKLPTKFLAANSVPLNRHLAKAFALACIVLKMLPNRALSWPPSKKRPRRARYSRCSGRWLTCDIFNRFGFLHSFTCNSCFECSRVHARCRWQYAFANL